MVSTTLKFMMSLWIALFVASHAAGADDDLFSKDMQTFLQMSPQALVAFNSDLLHADSSVGAGVAAASEAMPMAFDVPSIPDGGDAFSVGSMTSLSFPEFDLDFMEDVSASWPMPDISPEEVDVVLASLDQDMQTPDVGLGTLTHIPSHAQNDVSTDILVAVEADAQHILKIKDKQRLSEADDTEERRKRNCISAKKVRDNTKHFKDLIFKAAIHNPVIRARCKAIIQKGAQEAARLEAEYAPDIAAIKASNMSRAEKKRQLNKLGSRISRARKQDTALRTLYRELEAEGKL